MSNILNTLQNLEVKKDDYVYLNYEERAGVWHIEDNYVEGALRETDTPERLAALLATPGVTVLSRYNEDILATMRNEGLLEDYDREGWFEEYLAEKIREEAYQHDLLTIATERHDHKRGTCEVSANVKVRAEELFALGATADNITAGFDVLVQTEAGTLRVNT